MKIIQRYQLIFIVWVYVSKGQVGREVVVSQVIYGQGYLEIVVWFGLVNFIKCKFCDLVFDVLDYCLRGFLWMLQGDSYRKC